MNKKNIILIVAAVVIALVVAAVLLMLNKTGESVSGIIYYLNREETELVPESVEFKFDSPQDVPLAVINKLKTKKKSVANPLSDACRINTIVFGEDGRIEVDFSEEFLSDNTYKNVLRTYAVVKSICASAAFCGVTEVKVSVDNEPVKDLNGNDIDFLSGADIVLVNNGGSRILYDCMLYYKDKLTGTLRAEKRVIEAGAGNLEKTVVNELIKGPVSKELTRIFSYDTELVSVQTIGGICFVNLKNIPDNVNGNLAITSIIKTLTSLQNVEKVQILLDGKTVDEIGGIDVSAPVGQEASDK